MAIVLSMLFPNPANANTVQTITKEELRTATPTVIQEKLKDQIWQMFEREDYRRSTAPRNPLTGLSLKTRTLPTTVPGLCRYDVAHIEFEPVDKHDPDASTPSKATALTADSYFRFVSPPTGSFHQLSDNSQSHETPCSTLGDEGFFNAEDEEEATDGYLIWSNLQRALREKRAVPLDCDLFKTDTKPCAAIVTEITPNELTSVSRCTVTDYHEQCLEIRTNERAITIYSNAHVSPGPPPNAVRRAKVEGLIVMWHSRVD